MIRVALVDDQAIVRAGLARILSPTDGFDVVAECVDGQAAVEELPDVRPDVILMDIRMPRVDGIAATGRLRPTSGVGPVLVLTTFGEDEVLWGAIEAGAAGFIDLRRGGSRGIGGPPLGLPPPDQHIETVERGIGFVRHLVCFRSARTRS